MPKSSLSTQSGNIVAPLFYGTAWKKTATSRLVALALAAGFRAIDTACQPKHYREDLVGDALSRTSNVAREDLFVQTKFTLPGGQDPTNIPYDINAKLEDQVRQSFSKSLQNLQTDYIDAVLLHSPARTLEVAASILNVLLQFKERGQIRYLGISNIYSLPMLKEICTIVPKSTVQIIQNRFYQETGYDMALRDYCRENDIVYQSFWTLTGNPHILKSERLKAIAKRLDASVEGVFYRFCIQKGIIVLDGTTSEDHMKEDLAVVSDDRFELTPSEMSQIQALLLEHRG
jgi:diketogulonate reductase-like aldo/keto reductase